MPGMITVSQSETFSAPPIAMAVGPRLKFGTDEQDVTRDGERKWSVQVAVSYVPEFGMKAQAEVIEVTHHGRGPRDQPRYARRVQPPPGRRVRSREARQRPDLRRSPLLDGRWRPPRWR